MNRTRLEALRLGAYALVPKDTTPDTLFETIESVMAGHYWGGLRARGQRRARVFASSTASGGGPRHSACRAASWRS